MPGIDIRVPNVIQEHQQEKRSWIFFHKRIPRSEVIFIIQAILIFFLALASVISLFLSRSCEETTVWVGILSSSVGYMLPAPRP
jgi:steroid 5-alpha reductase family enzyme